jgi:hypothetical protein
VSATVAPGPHPADLHPVTVADRGAVEGHRVVRVDQVSRTGRPGERQAAGDVVVVHVCLGHVGDPHAGVGGQGDDPVDVPLRVDDQGGLAVMHQVAAVAERRCLDREHFHHGRLSFPGGRP